MSMDTELERERMRLAACGVVAMADTPESAQKARDMKEEYRSASCEDVARRVDECMALRAERDALAARLAELEGQEPVAWVYDWQAPEGLIKGWVETNRDAIPEDATNIRPLYARPAPAEPVNARLLEALIQCRDRFIFYVEHHLANGAAVKAAENDRFVTLANQAIAAAEAQQAGPVRPKVSFIPSVENMPMARSIDDEMMDLVDRLGALEPVDPRAWKHLLVYAPKTDPVRLTRVDIEKAFAQAGLKPEDYREDGEILPLVIAIESAALRKNGIEVAE